MTNKVIVGEVTECIELPQRDGDGNEVPGKYLALVTLSDAVRLTCIGARQKEFPANGLVAAFEVKRSQSGKLQAVRWGWVDYADPDGVVGQLDKMVQLSVDWQYTIPVAERVGGRVRSR